MGLLTLIQKIIPYLLPIPPLHMIEILYINAIPVQIGMTLIQMVNMTRGKKLVMSGVGLNIRGHLQIPILMVAMIVTRLSEEAID